MGLFDVLKDDFTSGTLLEQFPGNGSFNFPGTVAQITCPNSASCNYDNNEGNAPVLWTRKFHERPDTELLPTRLETKLNSYTRTTNSTVAGLLVCDGIDAYNFGYEFGYYPSEGKIIVTHFYGTAGARRATSGSVVDPNTTPHLYRIYWNQSTTKPFYIAETDTVLAPDYVGFAYSVDAGTTWTMLHTRVREFSINRAAVYARKWAAGAGDNCTAEFEYFYVEQYGEEDYNTLSSGARVAAEEGIEFPPLTGEVVRGSAGIERARVISAGARIAAEEGIVLPPAGGEASHRSLGLEHGQLLSVGSVGAVEDIELQLDEGPTYMDGKNDLDGQELLQGIRSRVLSAGDLTLSRWNTHPSGFHGTCRDGKNYYDGEECTPTGPQAASFGTVAGGPNRRCWTQWTNSPPMEWGIESFVTMSIPVDGTVRMAGTALNNQGGGAHTMWYLDGDFDIQVQLSNWSESGGTDGGISFQAFADQENSFYIRRRISGGVAEDGRFDKDVRINGSWGSYAFVNAAGATATWFRLVRSGNNVSSYYGSPGSWTQVGSAANMGRAEPMWVSVSIWGVGTVNMSGDFANFAINSGTVINTVAWAREAEGTHRGTQDDFPTKYLWVATNDSLNLMDSVNDKLWMRFIEGSGQVLGTGWGGTDQWVHDVAFSEGVALVAWHGALIRIDFNLSDIRIGRLLTDTNRGAARLNANGYERAGWRNAGSDTNSHIVTRNTTYGFGTPSLDAWQIDSRDVNSVDLSHVFEYEYRAIASAGGLRMHKARRWYLLGSDEENIGSPDWSAWSTAKDVRFCRMDVGDQEVFWIDVDEDMHSTTRAVWEAAMDESTFAAGTTKALPGTRSYPEQYMFVRVDPYIFLPTDEGVYRINWPSGSWELFYGAVGSGATHEVLPSFGHATTLTTANDGSQNLLVIGMVDGVAVVDRNIHTLYGQSPIKRAHFTEAVAV